MPTTNAELSKTKIAIVTGGSRGLGRNTVLSLAKRGVHSIFTYNSNRAEADKVVACRNRGGSEGHRPAARHGNVELVRRLCEERSAALAGLGAERFDYLVNNAGTSHHNSFEKTTEEELDSLIMSTSKACFS